MSFNPAKACADLEVVVTQGKGELHKVGSVWTFPGCAMRDTPGVQIPTWYTTTEIVEGLIRRGVMYLARRGVARITGLEMAEELEDA